MSDNKKFKEELEQVMEKYVGFEKLAKATNPAIAAAVGRKKYGKKKFQDYAAKGKKMKGVEPKS
jgi:hypothetical protein